MSDAIYFDGYLPAGKQPIRLSRLRRDTMKMELMYSKNLAGLPRQWFIDDASSDSGASQEATTTPLSSSSILPPAFLVPSIFALLQQSQVGGVVHLVPGEADVYCASHAAHMDGEGIIMTSDSDLLLYNTGNGRVLLLKDLDIIPASSSQDPQSCPSILEGLIYHVLEISERLGLQDTGGLLRLGFECHQSLPKRSEDILSRCRSPLQKQALPEFEIFSQAYELIKITSFKQLSLNFDASGQHARLSELARQLYFKEATIKMFLPVLIEAPNSRSNWDQSTSIRQLAYSIARLVNGQFPQAVHEYRRLQSLEQKGRAIQVLSEHDTLTATRDALERLQKARISQLTQKYSKLRWFILFVVFAECDDTCHDLWKEILRAKPKTLYPETAGRQRISWSVLQFYSRVHAVLYSLHMLFGILSCSGVSTVAAKYPVLAMLRNFLDPIPHLKEWPEIGCSHETLGDKGRRLLRDLKVQLETHQVPYFPDEKQASLKPNHVRRDRRAEKTTETGLPVSSVPGRRSTHNTHFSHLERDVEP